MANRQGPEECPEDTLRRFRPTPPREVNRHWELHTGIGGGTGCHHHHVASRHHHRSQASCTVSVMARSRYWSQYWSQYLVAVLVAVLVSVSAAALGRSRLVSSPAPAGAGRATC